MMIHSSFDLIGKGATRFERGVALMHRRVPMVAYDIHHGGLE